jgi:hypothetical protein
MGHTLLAASSHFRVVDRANIDVAPCVSPTVDHIAHGRCRMSGGRR